MLWGKVRYYQNEDSPLLGLLNESQSIHIQIDICYPGIKVEEKI